MRGHGIKLYKDRFNLDFGKFSFVRQLESFAK